MYVQKEFMKQILYWCYVQILFPIIILSYHWLLCISVQTDFVRMYVRTIFALLCLRQKQRMHNKKTIYILYAICRVVDFKRYNWLKTIIFIKWFEKFSLGILTFWPFFGQRRNCIIIQYGSVYNHRSKTGVGGVLKKTATESFYQKSDMSQNIHVKQIIF